MKIYGLQYDSSEEKKIIREWYGLQGIYKMSVKWNYQIKKGGIRVNRRNDKFASDNIAQYKLFDRFLFEHQVSLKKVNVNKNYTMCK